MLMAATSTSISKPLEVYAADNCDGTSTCTNDPGLGNDNSQTNNCIDSSSCQNFVVTGDTNTQQNDCSDNSDCSNG